MTGDTEIPFYTMGNLLSIPFSSLQRYNNLVCNNGVRRIYMF